LPSEPRPQRPGLDPAERHLTARLVAHDEPVAAAEPRLDLIHVLQVHEGRFMHAEEHLGVEPFLELAQRVVGHARSISARPSTQASALSGSVRISWAIGWWLLLRRCGLICGRSAAGWGVAARPAIARCRPGQCGRA